MKTTVWDRIERVDVATNLESAEWEGEDAPTNAQPPAFVNAPKSGSGFWKGVVVGVGASAVLGGVTTVAGAVIVLGVYGLPTLPTVPAASMAIQVEEPTAEPVLAPVREIVVERPVLAAKVEPKKVEPKQEPKAVAALPKPESTRAPVANVVATPAPIAKVIATPEPVATRAPEAARPNRDELLQLALAAKQSRAAAAPAATPAPKKAVPAPKWEDEPAENPQLAAAAEDKWVPVDDTDASSSPSTDAGSDDLSTVLGQ